MLRSCGDRLWSLLGTRQRNKDLMPASMNGLSESWGESVGQKKRTSKHWVLTICLSQIVQEFITSKTSSFFLNDVLQSAVQNCLGKTDEFMA